MKIIPKQYFHQIRRFLAKVWLELNLQLIIIGVTGSYGKTSAVRAIAAVLSSKYSTNKTDLNLDTVFNLPITILKTRPWDEVLVLEYGIDHLGEMDQHIKLVRPKIAVLTGITPVHTDQEHLGSLENLISEKRKLVDSLPKDGWAVFNYDDINVRKIGLNFSGKKFFYGRNPKADVNAQSIKINPKGTTFTLCSGKEKYQIFTPLLGYPAIYSCLVAWIVGRELGVEKEKIIDCLAHLSPLPGRFSFEEGPLGTFLVNDSLRANLASTLAGLESFACFPGRKILVLGEMGEIGDLEEKAHRQVGQMVARLKIDKVVGVGPLTKFVLEEASKTLKQENLFWAKNVIEAADILKKIVKEKDLLYLKASRLRHLERILLILQGKKVNCSLIVCHRYTHCANCPLLNKDIK